MALEHVLLVGSRPGALRAAEKLGLEVSLLHSQALAGDRIARRVGSGQDVGSIDAVGNDRDEVAETLRRAHDALRIELRPPGEG